MSTKQSVELFLRHPRPKILTPQWASERRYCRRSRRWVSDGKRVCFWLKAAYEVMKEQTNKTWEVGRKHSTVTVIRRSGFLDSPVAGAFLVPTLIPDVSVHRLRRVRGTASSSVRGSFKTFVYSLRFQNKTSDGLTIPLTHPSKTQAPSRFSKGTLLDQQLWLEELLVSANIKRLFRTVVRDWIFLALLGFIMAALSFLMDYAILELQQGTSFKIADQLAK